MKHLFEKVNDTHQNDIDTTLHRAECCSIQCAHSCFQPKFYFEITFDRKIGLFLFEVEIKLFRPFLLIPAVAGYQPLKFRSRVDCSTVAGRVNAT
jgi:hypothetical protein